MNFGLGKYFFTFYEFEKEKTIFWKSLDLIEENDLVRLNTLFSMCAWQVTVCVRSSRDSP